MLVAIVILVVWGCNEIRDGSDRPQFSGEQATRSAGPYVTDTPSRRSTEESTSRVRLSEEEQTEQEATATVSFAAAAELAEEVFTSTGGYADTEPVLMNELAAGRDWWLAMSFTEATSDLPTTVSVAAPVAEDGSWGLAVWSPLGCHLMSKHPLQGTFRAQLEPDDAEWCTGDWARRDYYLQPWWEGDRIGSPRAIWTFQQPDTDLLQQFKPADEEELVQRGDKIAAFVASTASNLADEMLERDGGHIGATPDALSHAGASRDWLVPINFQAEESNSPLVASVDAPTEVDGSWGLAVWSPGGCLLVAKDPALGTFLAQLSPEASTGCSATSARSDYDASRGEEGDRPGDPLLNWKLLGADDNASADGR